jgi:hypothetical protein
MTVYIRITGRDLINFLIFSFFHFFDPEPSQTRHWEIRNTKPNETGVGSNDRSFNASSGKKAPVQNDLGNI